MDMFLIVLVLLVPIPLYMAYYFLFVKKSNDKGVLEVETAFKRVIKRNKLTISEMNKFADRLIAIDRKTGRLILIVYRNGITWEKCINVEEIMRCKINNIVDHSTGYIKEVNMELRLQNVEDHIRFTFFDDAVDNLSDLGRRIKQSKYWQKKIEYYVGVPVTNYRLDHIF
ncbi:MAG: hypothetical protein JNK79_02300 [Chitinophagaceae bacterium]|nr:hypothetical protein [Chitinophagaceae bacterium]